MSSDSTESKKRTTRRGRVLVDKTRCKGCTYCVDFCPTDVLAMSNETNAKGYHVPELIKEDECTACGLCEMICPDFAIRVIELPPRQEHDKSTIT